MTVVMGDELRLGTPTSATDDRLTSLFGRRGPYEPAAAGDSARGVPGAERLDESEDNLRIHDDERDGTWLCIDVLGLDVGLGACVLRVAMVLMVLSVFGRRSEYLADSNKPDNRTGPGDRQSRLTRPLKPVVTFVMSIRASIG